MDFWSRLACCRNVPACVLGSSPRIHARKTECGAQDGVAAAKLTSSVDRSNQQQPILKRISGFRTLAEGWHRKAACYGKDCRFPTGCREFKARDATTCQRFRPRLGKPLRYGIGNQSHEQVRNHHGLERYRLRAGPADLDQTGDCVRSPANKAAASAVQQDLIIRNKARKQPRSAEMIDQRESQRCLAGARSSCNQNAAIAEQHGCRVQVSLLHRLDLARKRHHKTRTSEFARLAARDILRRERAAMRFHDLPAD
jgi:hypothetical protein